MIIEYISQDQCRFVKDMWTEKLHCIICEDIIELCTQCPVLGTDLTPKRLTCSESQIPV